ncbi:CLUMA_CG002447, isoform A [Clunio marinus]|uniref:CLUMA_CG002447, isoform A n=1 Tax=Clunio marinus TaxID=568069 RepID=A0A1J1HKJ7_9DIPT|nr:CLUMA_CG002447, isoform A [Clunio marinus]
MKQMSVVHECCVSISFIHTPSTLSFYLIQFHRIYYHLFAIWRRPCFQNENTNTNEIMEKKNFSFNAISKRSLNGKGRCIEIGRVFVCR